MLSGCGRKIIIVTACAAALQQVVQNDPVNSRLEAVLAPALAPIFAYVARTPAISDAITAVAGANSSLVSSAFHACTLVSFAPDEPAMITQ